MARKRQNPTTIQKRRSQRTTSDEEQIDQQPERQDGKPVQRGSWGMLKLRYSDRPNNYWNKPFDESKDS